MTKPLGFFTVHFNWIQILLIIAFLV